MTEQQREAFEQWFETCLDRDKELCLGDKELCRHAWQAALSHAEGEAVPEAVKERVVEAIAEALGDAKDCIRVWTAWGVGTMGPDDFLDVAGDPDRLDEIAEAAITAMLAAAPTAPAGEPDDSDICERVELPHVLAWADGVRGDMRTEYADRITDEEARVAQAAWAAHTGEQPVSDPDGLTEPGRREAEQAYINCAFDYARDPIGSRDWVLFWNGWRARNAAPAPDEREIAAKGINDAAQYAQDWIEKQGAVTPQSTAALDAVQAYANSLEKKS